MKQMLSSFLITNRNLKTQFNSVQSLSCDRLCDSMDCSTPGLPVHHQLPEFTQTHVHWVGDAIQPSHPLSSPSPALNLSQQQGLFKWVSSSHQWPKYQSFSFNISPSNEYPGLNPFRMDWLDLLARDSQEFSPKPQNTQKNCTEKSFTIQIIMMVWSLTLTYSQTSWNVKQVGLRKHHYEQS